MITGLMEHMFSLARDVLGCDSAGLQQQRAAGRHNSQLAAALSLGAGLTAVKYAHAGSCHAVACRAGR